MAKRNQENKQGQNALSIISERAGKWYNIIILLVVIGTSIGSFMVSDLRHDNHEKENKRLENLIKNEVTNINDRLKNVEGINYELLSEQLNEIKEANSEITIKIEKTNERIDKVLELLVNK